MAVSFNFPEERSEFYSILTFRKYQRMRPNQPLKPEFQGMITLPLPQTLVDSYGINIGEAKLDILGNALSDVLAAGKTSMENYANEIKAGKGTLQFIKDAAIDVAALTPGISDTTIGQVAQIERGFVRNPHLTTLFEGVRLKTYTFTWKLAPRSEAEARQLDSIINYIKAYMHPEVNPNSGGFALDYPYLASLEFKVGENIHIPNVTVAFITDLQINSSGSGVPAFFKDGRAVSVEMGITLKEINIKTRADFLNPSQIMGPSMNNPNGRTQ